VMPTIDQKTLSMHTVNSCTRIRARYNTAAGQHLAEEEEEEEGG